jgi:mono/diheme cytochrome c family protein
LQLFQPGITTWEFLTGDNEAQAKQYTNAQGQLISQSHPGSGAVNSGTSCASCHTVLASDPTIPPVINAGPMEDHAQERGGIWEPTPVVTPVP